jgi:hypothetical protein
MTPSKRVTMARLRATIGRIATGGATAGRGTPRPGMPSDALAASYGRAWLFADRLPAGCIHEIEGAGWDAETGIAASSFAAASLARFSEGAILWAVQGDAPYAPRLATFGLDLDRLIFCRCRNDTEALAALEEALRTPGIAAAVAEVAHVTLTQSRRLHLVCERAGTMGPHPAPPVPRRDGCPQTARFSRRHALAHPIRPKRVGRGMARYAALAARSSLSAGRNAGLLSRGVE